MKNDNHSFWKIFTATERIRATLEDFEIQCHSLFINETVFLVLEHFEWDCQLLFT